MIVVTNVVKSFGHRREVHAVDGVTFTAPDGEITGLLGPNGAGKTTLLRVLSTLMVADSGTATVDGHDVVRDRYAVRRRIGVLSDARGLYPRLTARENIRYYGALHGLAGEGLDARIDELIQALSIGGIADRRAHGFSQGERMKVAIARALVHDPADNSARRTHQRARHHEHTFVARPAARSQDAGQVPAVQLARHAGSFRALPAHRHPRRRKGRRNRNGLRAPRPVGERTLEDAFVRLLGTGEGLAA